MTEERRELLKFILIAALNDDAILDAAVAFIEQMEVGKDARSCHEAANKVLTAGGRDPVPYREP